MVPLYAEKGLFDDEEFLLELTAVISDRLYVPLVNLLKEYCHYKKQTPQIGAERHKARNDFGLEIAAAVRTMIRSCRAAPQSACSRKRWPKSSSGGTFPKSRNHFTGMRPLNNGING